MVGHNLKSRARETRIENSYLMDGTDGRSSYLADFPDGGAVFLRGNLFQKGLRAENNIAIAYGAEGLKWRSNTLELVHNTVVNRRSGGSFISAPPTTQSVTLTANLFAGTGRPVLMTGGFANGLIAEQGNVILAASGVPHADNLRRPNFWPEASVLAIARLSSVLDPQYEIDAPKPHVVREFGTARFAGALQSPP
jgi:hypothetical protein